MAWDRRTNSFYLTLTSDTNEDLYPTNTTGDFTVQLASTTILEQDAWSLGLASVSYPYDFNTFGEGANALFEHDGRLFNIPMKEWHCHTLDELTAFLGGEVNKRIRSHYGMKNAIAENKKAPTSNPPAVEITLDSMKRVRLHTPDLDFDFGFSERLMQMMGLENQPKYSDSSFFTRQNMFSILKLVFHGKHSTAKITNYLFNLKLKVMSKKVSRIQYSEYAELIRETFLEIDGASRMIHTLFKFDEGFKKICLENVGMVPVKFAEKASFNNVFNTKHFDDYIKELERDSIAPNSRTHLYSKTVPNAFSHHIDKIIYVYLVSTLADDLLMGKTLYANMPGVINPYEILYIYTDLVKPELFNGFSAPILDIVKTEGEAGCMTHYRPSNIMYKKLDKPDITNFKVAIATKDSKPVPFLRGPSLLVLHFVKDRSTTNQS